MALKSIKIEESLQVRLKALAKGRTISQVIGELLEGDTRTDMDVLLDQQRMMFDFLVDMDSRMGSPKIFSENSKGFVSGDDSPSVGVVETRQEVFLRIKAEQAEVEKRRKHAIEHPEDEDQSGGTF